jgi:protocatechuate 3,4-dioxygenase, beta subunit
MDQHERAVSRRELLRLGVAAGVAAVWRPRGLLWGWDADPLPITPNVTIGPFYPLLKPMDRDMDLTRIKGKRGSAQGQVIHVSGWVRNRQGEPVVNAQVELWQANTFGRYDHPSDPNPAPLDPNFQGYAVQRTDGEGRFRFVTIKPGPYPRGKNDFRTPHLHFDVTGRVDRKITQMFFPGEALNDQDLILRGVPDHHELLMAQVLPPTRDMDPSSRLVVWDIVVPQG